MPPAIEPAAPALYQFHVLLLHISPAIWRRILVLDSTTVAQLHAMLQISMGWSDTQPYRFALHAQQYGRRPQPDSLHCSSYAEQALLSSWRLRPKERLLYYYGLYFNWHIQLRLENVLPHAPTVNYPCCLAGARQAPPEYCFGASGFLDLRLWNTPQRAQRRLLAIADLCSQRPELSDSYTAEVRRLCYWLQPDHFDRKATNTLLQQQTAGTYIWPPADQELSQCRLK